MDVTDQYPDLVKKTDDEAAQRHAREAKEEAERESKGQETTESKDDVKTELKDAQGNVIPAYADTSQDDWANPTEMTEQERKEANIDENNELIIDFSQLQAEKDRWRRGETHTSDELYDDPNSDVIPEETPEPELTPMFEYMKDELYKKFDRKDDEKDEKGQSDNKGDDDDEPIPMIELQARVSYQFEAIVLEYIDPNGEYEDMVREQFDLYINNNTKYNDDPAWPDMMQVFYPREKKLKEQIKAEMIKLYKSWLVIEKSRGFIWKKQKVHFPDAYKPNEQPKVFADATDINKSKNKNKNKPINKKDAQIQAAIKAAELEFGNKKKKKKPDNNDETKDNNDDDDETKTDETKTDDNNNNNNNNNNNDNTAQKKKPDIDVDTKTDDN